MANVRLVSMRVRPKRSADVGFAVQGVIDQRYLPLASIGTTVAPFAMDAFLAKLSLKAVDAGGVETGRFHYTSSMIRAELEASGAVTHRLKAEVAGATLDQAINARESKWQTRFRHKASIAAAAASAYPDKLNRLRSLRVLLTQQHDQIDAVYVASNLAAQPLRISHRGEVESKTPIGPVTQKSHAIRSWDGDRPQGNPPPPPRVTEVVDDIVTDQFVQTTTTSYNSAASPPYDESSEIRHLPIENRARYVKGVIDLIDQELTETITSFAMLAADKVLENELANIDLEIFKLQVDFVGRFLVCPFAGRIVTVYHDAGEAVGVGDGVVRVESDDSILLLARFRSDLALIPGVTKARIQSVDLFDPAGLPSPVDLDGIVVSIRGHDAEIDQWDAVIECSNAGAQKLSINYEFEPDATVVTLT